MLAQRKQMAMIVAQKKLAAQKAAQKKLIEKQKNDAIYQQFLASYKKN